MWNVILSRPSSLIALILTTSVLFIGQGYATEPAFPPGTGLNESVCNASPAVNAYQNIGLRWDFNANSGTNPDPLISNTSIFDSATIGTYVGINATINRYSVSVDADSVPSSYDANAYIQYQFTTAAFTNQAEVRGIGLTLFGKKDATYTHQTGRYHFAIAIDDDVNFATPKVLMNDISINNADTSQATVASAVTDNGSYLRTFSHWDPNGSTVTLNPSTTYSLRIYLYDVTEFGDKNTDDYPNTLIWDDFMLKAVSCVRHIDYGDTPTDLTSIDANMGSSYGDASHAIDSSVHLGETVDADTTSQNASLSADGDDTDGGNDDDGVLFDLLGAKRVLKVGMTNQYTVTASVSGYLNAWVDWNQDGDWNDVYEQIATNKLLTAGSNLLSVAINQSLPQGLTYARFRFTSHLVTDASPFGLLSNGEVEDYAVTIMEDPVVGGRVYIDINSNTINDSLEMGIAGTVVVLRDIVTGVCRSEITTGEGNYIFRGVDNGDYEIYQAHGDTTPVPQSCGLAWMKNPAGYQSTSLDRLAVTVNDADIFDQNFGEVAGNAETGLPGNLLTPDNESTLVPGASISYSHVFNTTAHGMVIFDTFGSLNVTGGWLSSLYNDSNCDGVLNGSEVSTVINSASLNVAASSQLCLINRVYAPSNALPREQYQSDVTATFDYAGGALPTETLTARDLTIIIGNHGGTLKLEKSVSNLTQGGAYKTTTNKANPGDELRYRLIYSNTSTAAITDVMINDLVPAFTNYKSGSAECNNTPITMACVPTINGSQVKWAITGTMPAGSSGEVSFNILIDY